MYVCGPTVYNYPHIGNMRPVVVFDTLRRLQVLPNIAPIIVYSQAVQKEMAVQALSLGAKSYLIKPQKPEVIIQKAKELLNGKL